MFYRLANSQTSLDGLPSEILVRIFDYVHQEQLISKPVEEIRLSELRTHSLFPYSLLHLCKPIRQIVLRVPRFMTLIVVFVDEFNSRSALTDLFQASGSLLMDAFFISKHIQNPPTVDKESEEMFKVLDVFADLECMQRCRTLIINVRKTTSLPPVHKLSGNYPNFKTLRFFARRQEKIPQLERFWYGRPRTKEQRLLGDLRHLILSGSIFAHYVSLLGWPESFVPLVQKQLTIYDFDPVEVHGRDFSLYNLIENLAKMGHFASLTLFNINLDFSSCRNNRKQELYVENLHLQGFSSEKLLAFWKCIQNRTQFTSLTFEKCGLITDGWFMSHGMALRDINTDSDTLLEMLKRWDGVSLDLTRCTGVDDKLIKLMCRKTANAKFYLQNLRNLTIDQCRSSPDKDVVQTFISPDLLKRLIKARLEAAGKHKVTTELYHTLPMWSVYLRGEGPALSADDMNWFYGHLERFGWYSQPVDVPALVDDFAEWDWEGVVLPGDNEVQPMVERSQPTQQTLTPSASLASTSMGHPIDISPRVKEEVKIEEEVVRPRNLPALNRKLSPTRLHHRHISSTITQMPTGRYRTSK
ncbi:hypothetical protein BJ165DRAFT_1502901 [Panaeolus papilionaceus]|nr:hypothetical protein BJ165DRAFT_1502901 [Panaeolus papilionaceus]